MFSECRVGRSSHNAGRWFWRNCTCMIDIHAFFLGNIAHSYERGILKNTKWRLQTGQYTEYNMWVGWGNRQNMVEVFQLTLSLPRVISPAASPEILRHAVWRTLLFIANSQMKNDCTTNSHYLTCTFLPEMVGRMYFLDLGVPVCLFLLRMQNWLALFADQAPGCARSKKMAGVYSHSPVHIFWPK